MIRAAKTAAAMAIGALTALCAQADVSQYVMLSGFGTFGGVHSDYPYADFTGTISQPHGPGYGGSWSATPDSDLGLQANFSLTDRLSGVVQVLSRDDAAGNFKPEVEWANVKFDVTPDLAIRAGRVLLPTYERSDIQNVGYSLPWVRVPLEITYASSATHNDGLDVLYRVKTGAITHDLEAQWGVATEDLPGLDFDSNRAHVVLLGDTLKYRDLSVHLVYQNCEPIGFPPARMSLFGLGGTYDVGAWFLSEDSSYTRDEYFGNMFAWYLSAGMRIGRFTPYAVHSSIHQNSIGTSTLQWLGNEHTEALGVRWDFAKNVDFKMQYERVTIGTWNDPAAFALLQPGLKIGDQAHVVSLALDFVF